MLELLIHQPIFIGFKVDSGLRQHLESLSDADKKYISSEDSTFLRLCRVGEDIYVGKVIHESLTTDHVDDICRNILSILRKLGHAVRLPTNLKILACGVPETDHLASAIEISPPRSARIASDPRPVLR
ncbi:MAG TPA: hypothetical protein VFT43_01640 [Candidatus Polarisedimenticolia bacterium]|nr:hypothetical protein [Candidatus Polarisedimenticolia bacterium]